MTELKNKRTFLAFLATLIVLLLCLLPREWLGPEDDHDLIPHFDKLVHFGMFFLFAYFWARASATGEAFRSRVAVIAVAVVSLAIATEWAQGFSFINRDPDVLDSLADIVGGFAGLLVQSSERIIRQQRRSLQAVEQ